MQSLLWKAVCYSFGTLIKLAPSFTMERLSYRIGSKSRRVSSVSFRVEICFLIEGACGRFLSNVPHIDNTDFLTSGIMGSPSVKAIPDARVPCLDHKLIWKRLFNSTFETIFFAPLRSKADLRGIYWLPEHWQVFYHQHSSKKESLHCGTNPR